MAAFDSAHRQGPVIRSCLGSTGRRVAPPPLPPTRPPLSQLSPAAAKRIPARSNAGGSGGALPGLESRVEPGKDKLPLSCPASTPAATQWSLQRLGHRQFGGAWICAPSSPASQLAALPWRTAVQRPPPWCPAFGPSGVRREPQSGPQTVQQNPHKSPACPQSTPLFRCFSQGPSSPSSGETRGAWGPPFQFHSTAQAPSR